MRAVRAGKWPAHTVRVLAARSSAAPGCPSSLRGAHGLGRRRGALPRSALVFRCRPSLVTVHGTYGFAFGVWGFSQSDSRLGRRNLEQYTRRVGSDPLNHQHGSFARAARRQPCCTGLPLDDHARTTPPTLNASTTLHYIHIKIITNTCDSSIRRHLWRRGLRSPKPRPPHLAASHLPAQQAPL